ncbi:MAG: ParB/RepB/Spo0J family partition protein [Lachnospirales bacterium]
MTIKKKGLGRGIEAFIREENFQDSTYDSIENSTGEKITFVDIKLVTPNKGQPRRYFDEEKIIELGESIKEFGILQPILVVKKGEGFVIVAGERRYRASKSIGLKEIPVIIKELSDKDILEIALIENLQRQDLNPLDEAFGLQRLHDEFFLNFDDISKRVGRSKGSISNSLSLLKLTSRVQDLILSGKLKASHARLLLKIEDEKLQSDVAEESIEKDFSLSVLESYIENLFKEKKVVEVTEYKVFFQEVEKDLQQFLGLKVKINDKNKKGKLEISYTNHNELDGLISLLKNK